MTSEQPPPFTMDVDKSSIARVYNYGLGGKDHFAVDREAARAGAAIAPDAREAGFANRAFIRRVVRHLAEVNGIRQFLDLGCGLPSEPNVHEVVHAVNPEARVVYVDNDPMVVTHGRALLADNGTTIVVRGDLRRPEEILNSPELREHLDLSQPIGLLLFAVLHHINDQENPSGIAEAFREVLCPGSHLAISHFHNPGESMPELAARVLECERVFNETLGTGRWRSREEIFGYFGDFELVEPGLVPVYEWHPDDSVPKVKSDLHHALIGGVARKR